MSQKKQCNFNHIGKSSASEFKGLFLFFVKAKENVISLYYQEIKNSSQTSIMRQPLSLFVALHWVWCTVESLFIFQGSPLISFFLWMLSKDFNRKVLQIHMINVQEIRFDIHFTFFLAVLVSFPLSLTFLLSYFALHSNMKTLGAKIHSKI